MLSEKSISLFNLILYRKRKKKEGVKFNLIIVCSMITLSPGLSIGLYILIDYKV
jgi:hypothetical protein